MCAHSVTVHPTPGTVSAWGHTCSRQDLLPWSSLSRGTMTRKQRDELWFQIAVKVLKETKAFVDRRMGTCF